MTTEGVIYTKTKNDIFKSSLHHARAPMHVISDIIKLTTAIAENGTVKLFGGKIPRGSKIIGWDLIPSFDTHTHNDSTNLSGSGAMTLKLGTADDDDYFGELEIGYTQNEGDRIGFRANSVYRVVSEDRLKDNTSEDLAVVLKVTGRGFKAVAANYLVITMYLVTGV